MPCGIGRLCRSPFANCEAQHSAAATPERRISSFACCESKAFKLQLGTRTDRQEAAARKQLCRGLLPALREASLEEVAGCRDVRRDNRVAQGPRRTCALRIFSARGQPAQAQCKGSCLLFAHSTP